MRHEDREGDEYEEERQGRGKEEGRLRRRER
jgi:hypothetical protein